KRNCSPTNSPTASCANEPQAETNRRGTGNHQIRRARPRRHRMAATQAAEKDAVPRGGVQRRRGTVLAGENELWLRRVLNCLTVAGGRGRTKESCGIIWKAGESAPSPSGTAAPARTRFACIPQPCRRWNGKATTGTACRSIAKPEKRSG